MPDFRRLLSDTRQFVQSTVRSVNPVNLLANSQRMMDRVARITQEEPSLAYNQNHVKELAATVYGESSLNKEEMKTIIDTVLNRRSQLGLNIKDVLTQKDRNGLPMYQADGGDEYQKYKNNKLDKKGEPEKKKMVDELISQLQTGNWKLSKFTNFDKKERKGAIKIGEHYFRTEFQGNKIKK